MQSYIRILIRKSQQVIILALKQLHVAQTLYPYSETEVGLAFEEDAGEKLLPKMNETKKLARRLKQKLSS